MNLVKFSALTCGGVLTALLAGCGGGGGGGSSSPSPTPTPTTPPVAGQLLLDQFDGSSLNTGTWSVYSTSQALQRTYFGFTPTIVKEGSDSFARFRLDSYNPDHKGTFFKGTEIFSRQRYAQGQGLEVQARLRAPNLPPGIIFAFFALYDRYNGTPSDTTYLKDEIDFEFLTAQTEQFNPQNKRNRLYLNIWDRWNVSYGYDGNDVNDGADTARSVRTDKTYQAAVNANGAMDNNYDYANWNTYTIRWLPDRTEYYLNGVLQRTEREVRPLQPLAVHFNIWTGYSDFNQAFSGSLDISSSSDDNRTYNFDVDYVRVRQLGTNLTSARIAPAEPLPANLKSYRNR